MRRALRPLALALVAVAAAAVAVLAPGGEARSPRAHAQDLEAQALQIERQLLCPQCTNKRLDVCEVPICVDMRALIRERLTAGASPDDILLFFSNRYGERVLADLPRSGFNLLLFGWVGGSLLFVLLLGGAVLLRLRRSASLAAAGALDAEDERWLDDQLAGRGGHG